MKCLSLWLVLAVVSFANAERQLYVSVDAAAGGDGSRHKPYQSLTQARDGIRTLRKAGSLTGGEAVTVYVEPGVYPLHASFELDAGDSGTAEAPVVYRAREKGKVRFQGGVGLDPASFQPVADAAVLSRLDAAVRDRIRVCDLSAKVPAAFPGFKTAFRGAPVAPWLYVNQRPMTLARWPNAGGGDAEWASFSKAVDTGLPKPEATDPALRKLHPGSFLFDDPRPARWNLSEGVWLLGYWTHDWSDEVIRIASYDKQQKIIALAAPHSYGINAGTWGAANRRFFAINALEELDSAGEWYLDRPRKLLYFYPDGDLTAAEIVLATLTEPLVKVNGAKYVRFVGLEFGYGHGDGIIARNADHLEIAGCVVANLAGGGISLDGSASSVRGCDLLNIGRGGISLGGGDRKSLTPAKNLAENNHIHHFGLFQRTYAPGIGVHGCGQIARNNRIHDAPHNAVLYGGNEHLLERNEVYRVVMETGDAGAFYTGRDWTSRGNILRNNYIHDLGSGNADHVNTMGIYLDDCDCGDTLVGNVFYRAGRAMMIGGGRDNPVLNNLVIDCPIGLHIDARGMTWKQWNSPADKSWHLEAKAEEFAYTQPPWSTKYPRLAAIMNEEPRQPLGNPILRNVFVDCTKQVCSFDGNVKKLLDKFEIADNLAVSTTGAAKAVDVRGFTNLSRSEDKPIDLGAGDLADQSFFSRWQAWIRKEMPSFETIPLEKIGLYQDEYRRTLPAR
ncbi:MAG: right-handed parallel beta-helix repeat-containing protein [Rhodopirellula sp.]|nr:right-handed parallel beta-helix repeat-containing protein [Rhodopirellula sp.]